MAPKHFKEMTPAQLREFIDGCHRAQDYDGQFNAACKELNGRRVSLTVPTQRTENGKRVTDTRTLDAKCVVLPGFESFALLVHRSIAARGKYTITEETTGCSLSQEFERRTSQADTVACLVEKFERYKMTPEKLQLMIDTQARHVARPTRKARG